MQVSFNMSLTIWDDLDDPYDHDELAANWQAIDAHDHTSGRGVQIPTGGVKDHAITKIKLAPDAVTTSEILNGTILGEDLADGAIGIAKLDPSILNKLSPLGQVIAWWRATPVYPLPEGWEICDGASVADHDFSGVGGSITIPDMRNKFILGASASAGEQGTTPDKPPAPSTGSGNVYGGNSQRTFGHTHTVAGHSHTVNSHSHTVNAHAHVVADHAHGIFSDGSHNHNMHSRLNAFIQGITVRDVNTFARSNSLQSLYVAGFNNSSLDDVVPVDGAHAHGGATTGATPGTSASAPGTDAQAPGTTSVALTTDTAAPGGDIRPNFCGLLYIIKVRHPS